MQGFCSIFFHTPLRTQIPPQTPKIKGLRLTTSITQFTLSKVANAKGRSHDARMSIFRTLLALAFILIFSSCASSTNSSKAKNDPLEGTYRLVQFNVTSIPTQVDVMLRISGDTISGQGPVNQWFGQIADGKISGLISTRQAGPQQLMNLEYQLLSTLEGSKLKLDGKTGIRFTNSKSSGFAEFQRIELKGSR